jgi:hypothetical protein
MKGLANHVFQSAALCALFFLATTEGLALSTGEAVDASGSRTTPSQGQPRSGGLVLRQSTTVPGSVATTTAVPQSSTTLRTGPSSPVAPASEVAAPVTEPAPTKAVPAISTPVESIGIETRRLNERMAAIERLLESNRELDRSMMMMMIKITLIVSGVTGLTGIGAVIAVVVLQARWINRVSETALAQPHTSTPSTMGWGARGLPEPARTSHAIQASRQQFSEAVQSLRSQIEAMEQGQHREAAPSRGPDNQARTVTYGPEETTADQNEFEVTRLLEKGTQLLDIGRADRALACFDQARVLAPGKSEVHLKRARTLEQLQRDSEALEAFDQVLLIDPSMVAANLGKAGILNRLERYNEALECYEKALGQTSVPKRPII